MLPAVGDGPAVIDHQVCVLYDSDTGEIRALFEAVTLDGAGAVPTPAEIETRARRQAAALIAHHTQRDWDDDRVTAMFADPDSVRAHGRKRVDLNSRSLVLADEARS